jgi:hypothetical protein
MPKLDGISPRNAVCTHCGFHLGGIPIKGVRVTCPECGKPVVFELTSPATRGKRSPLALYLVLFIGASLVALAAYWESGWQEPRTAAFVLVGMLAGMSVVVLVLRWLRRQAIG